MTDTSAATLHASIDSSTDLLTPEPEKMPMRWPRKQVTKVKVLSPRTPRSSGPPPGGELRNGKGDGPSTNGLCPSIGSRLAPSGDPPAEAALRRGGHGGGRRAHTP